MTTFLEKKRKANISPFLNACQTQLRHNKHWEDIWLLNLKKILMMTLAGRSAQNCTFSIIVFPRDRIYRRTWCMGPYAGDDYVYPHFTYTPESTPIHLQWYNGLGNLGNPMRNVKVDFIPHSGTLDLASGLTPHLSPQEGTTLYN
jgi:hypothetical protein